MLSKDNIRDVIKVCHENSILICADEVYQANVYKEGAEFHSFRKVMHEMGEPYADSVELISYHSTSKGLMGECGFRGGYMETVNLDPFVSEQLYKMKSIELCSNTIGQVAMALMVDPPIEGREQTATVRKYDHEM